MRRRQRCPRCGGPAIETLQRSPEDEPAAVCITCGYEFPLGPQARAGSGIPCGLFVVLAFLAGGLAAGIILALLSTVPNAGGWILILLGFGMVAFMGALEAGYLDRILPRRRGPRPPSPPREL